MTVFSQPLQGRVISKERKTANELSDTYVTVKEVRRLMESQDVKKAQKPDGIERMQPTVGRKAAQCCCELTSRR